MIRLEFRPRDWVVGLRSRATPGMRYRVPSAPAALLALAGRANFRPATPIDPAISEPAELVTISVHPLPCIAVVVEFVRRRRVRPGDFPESFPIPRASS